MATEIAEGGQATLDAFARMRDASLPLEEDTTSTLPIMTPPRGSPRAQVALPGTGSSSVNRSPVSNAK